MGAFRSIPAANQLGAAADGARAAYYVGSFIHSFYRSLILYLNDNKTTFLWAEGQLKFYSSSAEFIGRIQLMYQNCRHGSFLDCCFGCLTFIGRSKSILNLHKEMK